MGIREADDLNCTTIFLLPVTGHQRKDLLKHGFIEAYLDDKNHEPHYRNAVYLLFKPEDMESLQSFIDKEYRLRNDILEDYDYSGGYVVVVYKIPQKYIDDYKLFLEGKYSKFSEQYKRLFPEMAETTNKAGDKEMMYTVPYLVFVKGKPIKEYWENKLGVKLDKDMEYWSVPNINGSDTLDINKL